MEMEQPEPSDGNAPHVPCEEIEIEVPWGVVCGKWWGSRSIQPILALHGWQDNAGSFQEIAGRICYKDKNVTIWDGSDREFSFLAIDLPGHGKSSHYPPGMQYYLFWDGIALIRRIVKKFEWYPITMMGHSLGGALCFMYAASFPKDVYRFISIDMAGPTIHDHVHSASITGETIDRFLKYEQLPPSSIPSYQYDEMIDLVVDAHGGSLDRKSAKILMVRGGKKAPSNSDSGKQEYQFVRDVRLKASLMGMFSLEQVLTYAKQIKCEVLNIRVVPGMHCKNETVYSAVIEAMRKNAVNVFDVTTSGTHHVHLREPLNVIGPIMKFLRLRSERQYPVRHVYLRPRDAALQEPRDFLKKNLPSGFFWD